MDKSKIREHLKKAKDKEGALEGMFLLVGTIMTAVGIAICLLKGPATEP